MRHYLNKLAEHMRAREFPLDDELLVAVDEAHDAVRLLKSMLDCLANRGERRDECDADGLPVKLPSWITSRR